jgi:hypothetical protein
MGMILLLCGNVFNAAGHGMGMVHLSYYFWDVMITGKLFGTLPWKILIMRGRSYRLPGGLVKFEKDLKPEKFVFSRRKKTFPTNPCNSL